jgi:pyruvate formate lyase activating enzyme
MICRAVDIGRRNGLHYVYGGNLPGDIGDLENTRCHACGETLIERYGYFIRSYKLTPDGSCPKCATKIPGRWGRHFDGQITSRPFSPGARRLSVTRL